MASPYPEDALHPVIEPLESYLFNTLIPDWACLKRALKSSKLSRRESEKVTLEIERLEGLIAAYRKVLQNEKYLHLESCLAAPDALKVKIIGRPHVPRYEDMLPF